MNAKLCKKLRKMVGGKREPAKYAGASVHPVEFRERVRLCGVYTTYIRMGTMLVANKLAPTGKFLPITVAPKCPRGFYRNAKRLIRREELDRRLGFMIS